MLKKLLPILLALLLCAAAGAQTPLTLTITGDMAFFSGPGPQYTQTAFHNTPPMPGEEAIVLGRVPGTDGQDWLLVRFTGHWFSQSCPVQYYLPVSAAPQCAGAPSLSFLQEPNALAAETVRLYADPEGLNYDGWLAPDAAGVTVLAVEGGFAYIEAVNPYGFPCRGYVAAGDLTAAPGTSALPAAPEDTARRLHAHSILLTHAPQSSAMEALLLADGTLVLHYGVIPEDAPWGEALAVLSPDGQPVGSFIFRTHDSMKDTAVEHLLPGREGFRICLSQAGETAVRETHYTPDGLWARTELRRYAPDEPRPCMGTAHFTLSRPEGEAGPDDAGTDEPLRITTASGAVAQLRIDPEASVRIAECRGLLLLAVCDGAGTHLLVFDEDAAQRCQADLPEIRVMLDMQAVPMADGRIALLLQADAESWQSRYLDVSVGTLIPGPRVTAPANRSVALLAAGDGTLLIALSGVQTQLILLDGSQQQLAALIPGSLAHAHSDGQTATLLLLQDGQLRMEAWALQLP